MLLMCMHSSTQSMLAFAEGSMDDFIDFVPGLSNFGVMNH